MREKISSGKLTTSARSRRFSLIFLATGAFAVPSMRMICDSGEFEVQCLVTNPLRFDRHGQPIITPARQFAAEYSIPVCEKQEFKSQEFYDFIYLMRPDLLFVCDFGHILSKLALRGALLGGINLHGSLLPKYRGAAPVNWVVINGDQFTGVSIIHMEPAVDAGPVIAQSPPVAISPHENVLELEQRLAHFGAPLVLETIRKMASGNPVRIIEQSHNQSTQAPKLTKEHGRVNWEQSAQNIYNWFRATVHWPKLYTTWHRQNNQNLQLIFGEIIPLTDNLEEIIEDDYTSPIIVPTILVDAKFDNLNMINNETKTNKQQNKNTKNKTKTNNKIIPKIQNTKPEQKQIRPDWQQPAGSIIKASNNEIIVAAGKGAIKILQIQPAGKKMMTAKEFLSGYRINIGEKFG
ncbi:MAG: methionyl-tRNA formyltransferase [Planctomycetaceae bacterium]|nr:methionyl-tRNA formyltransferase [Planctomycetaceae bacterium]